MATSIYYDGNCPFCTRYVRYLRLQDIAGPVDLVDLREDTQRKDELIAEGFDLDKGFVVDMDGRRVGGAEAISQLAVMTTPSTLFNRITKRAFSNPLISRLLYPLLTSGRWLLLFLLGRAQLTSPESEGARARSGIFGSMFALFSVFHFFNYFIEYQRFPPQLDQFFILVCAILLFIRPQSARLLWLLMLVSTISAIAQAPVGSNHTIVRNFVVLGYWMSFFYAMARKLKWTDVFSNFTMAGQGSLLVMYFFGVFHKINSGFLSPETSCAVTLWGRMPAPLNYIDTTWMHYLAIYGTFAVEGLLVLMLFSKRTRHLAVVGGILFHLLLALSGYAMYISFTTLAISLHCLFLNEESALKIQNSKFMRGIQERVTSPIHFALAILLVLGLAFAGIERQYTIVTLLVLPIILPFCFVIVRYGSSSKPLRQPDNKRPTLVIGSVLTGLFFLNCWMPYLGLKSAQAVNMFANIRLEGGVSNHLIMKNAPGPFTYLEDVVTIDETNGDRKMDPFAKPDRGLVYYQILAYLADNPDRSLSYTRDGISYKNMTAEDLADDIRTTLHPSWFRKWFHFQPVALDQPEKCWN